MYHSPFCHELAFPFCSETLKVLGNTEDDFQVNFDPYNKTALSGVLRAVGVEDEECQQGTAPFKLFEQGYLAGEQLEGSKNTGIKRSKRSRS